MENLPKVVVVGSINMDLVIRCDRLPVPGETIIAESCLEIPGGKGANQAVAAARSGGQVRMVGRVGDDSLADRLKDNLRQQAVNLDNVLQSHNCASGIAIVSVESSGENSILVVPGANDQISVEDLKHAESALRDADVVLLQLEIPIPTVKRAIEISKEAGVTVVLDPAPMCKTLPTEMLQVDVICPNQSEATALVKYEVKTIDDAHRAAQDLIGMGARQAIITMSDQGAVVHDGLSSRWIEPVKIETVDTTAAGDAFAGALAVQLAGGKTLIDSARFAAVGGALAATKPGAQPAMPYRNEIKTLLKNPDD